jgi:excisionase family DNA binding protein
VSRRIVDDPHEQHLSRLVVPDGTEERPVDHHVERRRGLGSAYFSGVANKKDPEYNVIGGKLKMAEELLTPEQVAQRLKVTDRTVYSLLRSGRLRGARVGRLWRIRPTDLETFLSAPGEGTTGPLRRYSKDDVREFLTADALDPEMRNRVEQLLAG